MLLCLLCLFEGNLHGGVIRHMAERLGPEQGMQPFPSNHAT
jgi:hypothetical protein